MACSPQKAGRSAAASDAAVGDSEATAESAVDAWIGPRKAVVEGVRAAVIRLLDEEGADGIKMMATGGYMTTTTTPGAATYPLEVFEAAVEETHRRGRYITAHAHGVEGMRLASEAGNRCSGLSRADEGKGSS